MVKPEKPENRDDHLRDLEKKLRVEAARRKGGKVTLAVIAGLIIATVIPEIYFYKADQSKFDDIHAKLDRQEKILADQQSLLSDQQDMIAALPVKVSGEVDKSLDILYRRPELETASGEIAEKLNGQGVASLDGASVLEKIFPVAGKLLRKGLSEEEFITQFITGASQELGAVAVRNLIEAPLRKLGAYFYAQAFGSDTDRLLAKLAAISLELEDQQKGIASLRAEELKDRRTILARLDAIERVLRDRRGGGAATTVTMDGPVMEQRTIYFPLGKMKGATVDAALDALIPWLKKLESRYKCKVLVSGHADSTGPEDRNKFVANARAKYVAEYLNAKGFNVDYVSGWGERRQEKLTGDNVAEPKNRRAVITATCREKSIAANITGAGKDPKN
ncbi:MAG: hypothetical protein EP348_03695 [Alphaproteobacteria bacterium]|nr:MAG: hypothetical protein EP348_03695 [Alphaproteobacteria bacterium]